MALTSTGCANSRLLDRLNNAAAEQAAAETARRMPDLPADCRAQEPHAPLTVGAETRSVLKRERAATDRANARVTRCANRYDNLQRQFEGDPGDE